MHSSVQRENSGNEKRASPIRTCPLVRVARLELVDEQNGVWYPLFFCAETCTFQGRKRQFMSPDVVAWWSL